MPRTRPDRTGARHDAHRAARALIALAAPVSANPDFWKYEWPNTDFSKTSISNWVEILSGGPPRDGIPALSDPQFIRALDDTDILPTEPVMTVQIKGAEPRAYPIRYLIWHEIVNDTVGGVPIAVTYCPLCNSAITFDRRIGGRTLTFGVTGKLRNSGLVMYDRETESWWQQFLGEAIVGELLGTKLTVLHRSIPNYVKRSRILRSTKYLGNLLCRYASIIKANTGEKR